MDGDAGAHGSANSAFAYGIANIAGANGAANNKIKSYLF